MSKQLIVPDVDGNMTARNVPTIDLGTRNHYTVTLITGNAFLFEYLYPSQVNFAVQLKIWEVTADDKTMQFPMENIAFIEIRKAGEALN